MHLSAVRAYPTPLNNSTLLPLLLLSLTRQRHSPDVSTKIKREYDYIIVGGGTAGSVVASRLSELPCVSVLLLEAGHEPPLLSEVPALGRYFRSTDVDWHFQTVPQKYTGRALKNRQVIWPSGKMLGGSSSFNSMLYIRGNKRNYDDWAKQGAKGWNFKEIYPYLLKLEDNKDREFLANGYHTTNGPITVHSPRYDPEVKEAVYRAAAAMGYNDVDSNGEIQTGFFDHQATLRDNQRCSTAKAYLVPAENRTNIDILPNAMVKKIIIQRQEARAVQFDYNGYNYEVRARKEVIVSAGTVNTAKLLMLSGVGPKKELQRLNIPLVADLPVGENLQDHGGTTVPFVLNPRLPKFEDKISNPRNIHQYIRNRTGPLASTDGISYLAFLKGQAIYTSDDFPNYQLYFSEMTSSVARDQIGLKPEIYRRLYGPYKKKPLFVCTVSQLQPRSRGTVTLRSKDPYDIPVINPNYLEDQRDVEDIVQGMKTCERIGTSTALRKLGARSFKTLIPGCERFAKDEDKYFTCQTRSIFLSLHHYVGTAKMGDPRDPTTVVDPQLRVKNVKGLRVVDASIMPIIPSGDTNIPTIMVAEKASQMIKETVQCYKEDLEHWDEPEDSSEWSVEEKSEEKIETWDKWDKSREVTWEEVYTDVSKKQWNTPGSKKSCLYDSVIHHPEHNSLNTHPEHNSLNHRPQRGYLKHLPQHNSLNHYPDHNHHPEHHSLNHQPEHNTLNYHPEQNSLKQHVEHHFLNQHPEHDSLNHHSLNHSLEHHSLNHQQEHNSWPEEKDNSEEDVSAPEKHSWAQDGEYYLNDYIKNPRELVSVKNDKESSWKPYSWYKKQTELLLKEIRNMPKSLDEKNMYSDTPWRVPYNYKMSKSIDELVKLADTVPHEKSEAYRYGKPYAKSKVPRYDSY